MRYYLDCEFWGWRGDVISLALVGEDDRELYIALDQIELEAEARIATLADERRWMLQNVLPIIDVPGATATRIGKTRADVRRRWPVHIAAFLNADNEPPVIVADWPEDIRIMADLLMSGPGITDFRGPNGVNFEWTREDAYPTSITGAVQHNALWDARALRKLITGR